MSSATTGAARLATRIDHQFRAPGDPNGVFDSRFNDPFVLKSYGYTAVAGRYCETIVPFSTLPGSPLFPVGSVERSWMDAYGDALRAEMAPAKEAGLLVYNHMDFVVIPRALAERYAPQICVPPKTAPPCSFEFNSVTAMLLGVMFDEMFTLLPDLDGVLVRTGEHYIIDLPFHVASKPHPASPPWKNPISWLRDEIADKRDKVVVWRTWSVHVVTDAGAYVNMTDGIAPHPNLYFSAKHQGWDYWRCGPRLNLLAALHPCIAECHSRYHATLQRARRAFLMWMPRRYIGLNPNLGAGQHQQVSIRRRRPSRCGKEPPRGRMRAYAHRRHALPCHAGGRGVVPARVRGQGRLL
jgi:hypothetical protein